MIQWIQIFVSPFPAAPIDGILGSPSFGSELLEIKIAGEHREAVQRKRFNQ